MGGVMIVRVRDIHGVSLHINVNNIIYIEEAGISSIKMVGGEIVTIHEDELYRLLTEIYGEGE